MRLKLWHTHWRGKPKRNRQCSPSCCACNVQVRAKDDNGAMHFARDILVRAVKTDMDYQELQDALSLMGYDDPTTSPCGQMMSQHVRTYSLTLKPAYAPVVCHQT